jgi:hypothetical protein
MQPCTIGKYSKELHYCSRLFSIERISRFFICGIDARLLKTRLRNVLGRLGWHRLSQASLRQSRRDLPVDQVDGRSRRRHQTASGVAPRGQWSARLSLLQTRNTELKAERLAVKEGTHGGVGKSLHAFRPIDVAIGHTLLIRRPDRRRSRQRRRFCYFSSPRSLSRIVVGIVLRQISQPDS